jgi:hypothetical protein
MKKIVTIGILLLLVTGLTDLTAQNIPGFVGKRIKSAEKSTEKRLEREADKAVDKEVNKALDKIFGKEEAPADSAVQPAETTTSGAASRSAGTARTERALMSAMGLTAGAANVKPVYEFDGFVEMLITDYKNDKEEQKMTYTTFIDSKTFDYGMVFSEPGSEGTSTIIYDTENSLMLTLAEDGGEKNGFAVSFTPEQAGAIAEEDGAEESAETSEAESVDPYKSYKTGRSKKILGYTCEEYVIEDDNVVSTMWITDDFDKDMKKSYMQNTSFSGMFIHAYYTNGTVMEYITEYKNSNEKSVMEVTAIDMNKRNTINTREYNIISMGANMQKQEKEGGQDVDEGETEN